MNSSDFIVLERDIDGFRVVPYNIRQDEIVLQEEQGSWGFNGQSYKIGQVRTTVQSNPLGIIGVFDAKNPNQLTKMLQVSCEKVNFFHLAD